MCARRHIEAKNARFCVRNGLSGVNIPMLAEAPAARGKTRESRENKRAEVGKGG